MIQPLALLLFYISPAHASFGDTNLHFQTTVIDQGRPRIHAPYTGVNSIQADPESAVSATSTLFFGWRPLQGTEVYINPELVGGKGISGARGIAGFPNGETFRVGDPRPSINTARLYIKEIVGVGSGTEKVADAANQVAGDIPVSRWTAVVGKFSVADFFDNNAYSHDPRAQFMNWALMSSGAWDFPADTRGYTWGLMLEYHDPAWAVRSMAVAEPKAANTMDLDRRIWRAHGLALEGEHAVKIAGHGGTVRLLAFLNEARMGNYQQTIDQPALGLDITQSRAYGRTKYGIASSDDLELTDQIGVFTRLSWSDGRNETWAFTEIDSSAAAGLDWKAARFGRPRDHLGAAEAVNFLSNPHRRYLANGGNGFMVGDGAMHYGQEMITETYYKIQYNEMLAISPDAQFVMNPAYNRARGPIPVWGVRVHAEF